MVFLPEKNCWCNVHVYNVLPGKSSQWNFDKNMHPNPLIIKNLTISGCSSRKSDTHFKTDFANECPRIAI